MKRDKNKIKACFSKKQTLCWKCKKALGDCSWTKWDEDTTEILFQPVDGWVAEKTSLLMYSYDGTPYLNSHYVAQNKKQWAVQCRCGARFFFTDRRYKAIEAWNRRAVEEGKNETD